MNSTDPASASLPPLPPAFTNALTDALGALRPVLVTIIIQASLTTILIPLMLFLLWCRTAELTRSWMYYMNLVAIGLGISYGTLAAYLEVISILNPLKPPSGHILLAISIFAVMIPLFIQCILFWRLALVYCPKWTSYRILAFVWIPPAAFLIVRVVNIGLTLKLISDEVLSVGVPLMSTGVDAWKYKGTRLEMFLQVVDNTYISILFLCKLQNVRSGAGTRGHQHYSRRLKMLIWSASTSFVFPVMINLIELIFIYTSSDYSIAVYLTTLFFVNDIVQIVCSVLATLWVAIARSWETSDSDLSKQLSVSAGRTTIRTGPSLYAEPLGSSSFLPPMSSHWSIDNYTRFPDSRSILRSSYA